MRSLFDLPSQKQLPTVVSVQKKKKKKMSFTTTVYSNK